MNVKPKPMPCIVHVEILDNALLSISWSTSVPLIKPWCDQTFVKRSGTAALWNLIRVPTGKLFHYAWYAAKTTWYNAAWGSLNCHSQEIRVMSGGVKQPQFRASIDQNKITLFNDLTFIDVNAAHKHCYQKPLCCYTQVVARRLIKDTN